MPNQSVFVCFMQKGEHEHEPSTTTSVKSPSMAFWGDLRLAAMYRALSINWQGHHQIKPLHFHSLIYVLNDWTALDIWKNKAPANWHTQIHTQWVNYIVIVCCFYLWNSKSSPQQGTQGFSPSCCGWTTSASAPHKSGDTHFITTIF